MNAMKELASLAKSPAPFRQARCPVCANTTMQRLIVIRSMPLIECEFSRSRREALAVETGDIDLVSCTACGHVFNRTFVPERVIYSADYDNALDFSARHRAHLDRTVARLIENYGLVKKKIVEIGCGNGDFLWQLCERGGNHGIGYDPSQPGRPATPAGAGMVEIIGESFNSAALTGCDAICCQHVLEHLPDPVGILRAARAALVAGGIGYFEVPNGRAIIDRTDLWDLTYEHYSYFSPTSLARALTEAGFSVRRLVTSFGDQYLAAEATLADAMAQPAVEAAAITNCDAFSRKATRLIVRWRCLILRHLRHAHRVVLWGAGAKAVTFLNLLQLRAGSGIEFIVDLNPRKARRFLPRTGQEIVEPDFLRSYRPDVVIAMNAEYRHEIAARLRALRLHPEILTAVPVSRESGA